MMRMNTLARILTTALLLALAVATSSCGKSSTAAAPTAAGPFSWTQTDGPPGSLEAIAIKSTGELFAVADPGVFRSTNNGASWTWCGR